MSGRTSNRSGGRHDVGRATRWGIVGGGMLGLTLALFFMGRTNKDKPGHIFRWEGVVLLSVYAGYLVVLGVTA